MCVLHEQISVLYHFTFQQAGWHKSLLQAVDRLTVEQAAWRPDFSGSHSIAELVGHIIYWKRFSIEQIKGLNPIVEVSAEINFPNMDPSGQCSWEQKVEELKAVQNELSQLLNAYTESELKQVPEGAPMPIHNYALMIAAHDSYHIGQIILIRKQQGWWNE